MNESEATSMRSWYETGARHYFEQHAEDRVEALDATFARLELPPQVELPICFLGGAGVGKSTLLNAIVAGHRTLVPQGGVGPLTAQATLVRYSRERKFVATYLPWRQLNNVLFALERAHERELKAQGTDPGEAARLPDDVSEDEQLELEAALPPDDVDEAEEVESNPREKIDAYARQALLLVRGSQFSAGEIDVCYLMDSLRECLELPRRWGSEPSADDAPRIERVRRALAEETYELSADTSFGLFQDELEVHASGFLAPLIKTLEVWWDAEALSDGVVLVDLPGVGVANDEYRRVTAEWIRRARAVVLVVDRAGVTEASAELLRTTGFLNSLLHDTSDPDVETPILIIAAVKLDLVASSDWSTERERLGPDRARKWMEHFDHVCSKMTEVIRGQVQHELEKIADSGPESTRSARHEVLRQVTATLQVHPVSAWEFRKLLRDDDEDRARIRKAEDSHVPELTDALRRVGREHAQRTRARYQQALGDARQRARATLELVLEQWREGARADEEAARLRQELDVFAEPLRKELFVRHGAFREFLRDSMPREIRSRTEAISHEAEKDIAKYLRRYEKYHWATLRAAIRKGGTFAGSKHIDLPNELTLRFEEPIAVVWSQELLVQLRRRTRELAEDHVRLVGEVLDWARGQGARVRPQLIESLHDELKAHARGLSGVGRDAIGELREQVKQQLFAKVEEEVRRRCNKFVASKKETGTGTKKNILEFLREDLAEAVVGAARPAALRVLETNYRMVEREIVEAFQKVPDPVASAVEAIAAAHGDAVKRSDAQKRRGVIEEGERLLAGLQASAS